MTNRTTITLASLVAVLGLAASVKGQGGMKPAPSCPAGSMACADPQRGTWGPCRDTASFQADERNCGACGNLCRVKEKCEAGKCVAPNSCPAGYVACKDPAGRPEPCRDVASLQSDINNCGACGNLCKRNEKCVQGVCNACPAGSVQCMQYTGNMACITNDAMQYDKHNCGSCGKECRMGQECRGGVCK